MPNMASTISSHNNFVLGMNPAPADGGCNWWSGAEQCALNGRCLMTSLMYKSIVSTEKEHKEYTGLTPSSRGTQLTQPSTPHHPLKLHLEPEIQQQHLLFCLLVHYEAGPKRGLGQGPGDWGNGGAVPHQTEEVSHLTALGKES